MRKWLRVAVILSLLLCQVWIDTSFAQGEIKKIPYKFYGVDGTSYDFYLKKRVGDKARPVNTSAVQLADVPQVDLHRIVKAYIPALVDRDLQKKLNGCSDISKVGFPVSNDSSSPIQLKGAWLRQFAPVWSFDNEPKTCSGGGLVAYEHTLYITYMDELNRLIMFIPLDVYGQDIQHIAKYSPWSGVIRVDDNIYAYDRWQGNLHLYKQFGLEDNGTLDLESLPRVIYHGTTRLYVLKEENDGNISLLVGASGNPHFVTVHLSRGEEGFGIIVNGYLSYIAGGLQGVVTVGSLFPEDSTEYFINWDHVEFAVYENALFDEEGKHIDDIKPGDVLRYQYGYHDKSLLTNGGVFYSEIGVTSIRPLFENKDVVFTVSENRDVVQTEHNMNTITIPYDGKLSPEKLVGLAYDNQIVDRPRNAGDSLSEVEMLTIISRMLPDVGDQACPNEVDASFHFTAENANIWYHKPLCSLYLHGIILNKDYINLFQQATSADATKYLARVFKVDEEGIGNALFGSEQGARLTFDSLMRSMLYYQYCYGVSRCTVTPSQTSIIEDDNDISILDSRVFWVASPNAVHDWALQIFNPDAFKILSDVIGGIDSMRTNNEMPLDLYVGFERNPLYGEPYVQFLRQMMCAEESSPGVMFEYMLGIGSTSTESLKECQEAPDESEQIKALGLPEDFPYGTSIILFNKLTGEHILIYSGDARSEDPDSIITAVENRLLWYLDKSVIQ